LGVTPRLLRFRYAKRKDFFNISRMRKRLWDFQRCWPSTARPYANNQCTYGYWPLHIALPYRCGIVRTALTDDSTARHHPWTATTPGGRRRNAGRATRTYAAISGLSGRKPTANAGSVEARLDTCVYCCKLTCHVPEEEAGQMEGQAGRKEEPFCLPAHAHL